MNFKTTGILALVLIIGVVAVVLLDKQDEKKEEQQELEEQILNIDKDQVSEIILQPSGIHCVKDSAEWDIVAPVETDGDKSSIDALANMFDWAKIDRVISSDPSEYSTFGLDPAQGRLILVHDRGTDTIYVGDKSPTGSFVFARQSGSPEVFLTTTTLKTNVEKSLFDLRDKSVLGFEASQVRSVDLDIPDGEFTVSRIGGIWKLTSPVEADADRSEVDNILNRMSSERTREFVEESPDNLGSYGLAPPAYHIDVYLGENRAQKTLLVGDATDGRYYAKDASRSPVFLVDSAFVNILNTSLYDLRNKDLADFSTSEVNKFELEFSGQTIVCEKDTAGTWMVLEPELRKAKSWKMSSITREASQLEVVQFVDDNPTSLSKYGLASPQVNARFYKDDQVLLDVSLGNTVDENVYAKVADAESVYLVESNVLDAWQPELEDISEAPQDPEEQPSDVSEAQ